MAWMGFSSMGEDGRDRGEAEMLAKRSTDVLQRILERHIVPRLVLSHPDVPGRKRAPPGVEARVSDLAEFAMISDDAATESMINALHKEGVRYEALQLGLLAPAAERLGLLWCDDEIDFIDVTVATNTLIRAMRFISLTLERRAAAERGDFAALIAPAPGEQHIFGAAMAAEFFQRGGWQVSHLAEPTAEEIASELRSQRFDVLGLSLTEDERLPDLAELIGTLRRASCNPNLVVIVGGPVFLRDPALVSAVGADATIATVESAPFEMRHVLERMNELR